MADTAKIIQDSVANARPVDDVDDVPLHDDMPHDDSNDGAPPEDRDPYTAEGLPKDCPVIPLGKKGMTFFYLNPLHELVALAAREHSQTNLPGLFAPQSQMLPELWPRRKMIKVKVGDEFRDEWITVGWDVARCFQNLMDACARKGVWKSMERIRGAGGWKDDDGRVVYHCGDVLWHLDDDGNPVTVLPGVRGNYVYVADAPILRPHPERQRGGEDGPAWAFLDVLRTWVYERPALDPMLLLGQALCSMTAGGHAWRPMVFITGDMATGKSNLQHHLRHIHGIGGMIDCENATEAGVAAAIGQSCLPVLFDEIENEADNKKAQDILMFARLNSSGGYRRRATQNIDTQATRAQSCFTFSAIIMPSMPSQDRRRMGIIRLKEFAAGAVPPDVSDRWLHEIGGKLKRRVADQWHRLPALQHDFTVMLSKAGHTSATLKQYSTMMAMAWLALYDHDVDDVTMNGYQAMFKADTFRETSDIRSHALSALDELVQAQPDVFKGGVKKSIAQIIREIVDFLGKNDDATLTPSGVDHADLDSLKKALAATALALTRKGTGTESKIYLAVPTAHRLIAQIYQATDWKAKPGTPGGWSEALARLPGAIPNQAARIAGKSTKCVLVPLEHVLPPDDIEAMDEKTRKVREDLKQDAEGF